MKSGIYALASLDGSPLNPDDLELLGLSLPIQGTGSQRLFYGRAVDELPTGTAIDIVEEAAETSIFLGYLNEPDETRAEIGEQLPLSSARLTKCALDRFTAETAWRLVGDYSFVSWDTKARELTLFTSQRIRDQLYWATDGKHIAVSPDQLLLTRLGWVGRSIDTIGFALTMSDYQLRRIRTTETMWTGVSRLPAGWSVLHSASGLALTPLSDNLPVSNWKGTFEEAVEEVTRIGRRIVGQQMARYGRTAFLLSGGLDSSLTTTLGAMERKSDDAMFCLTSIAPKGSGVPDEWAFSKSVADSLGLPMYPVLADGCKVLRLQPSASTHFGTPPLGLRQHLYEAIQQDALRLGSHLIVDGFGGEFTISTPRVLAAPSWPRRVIRGVKKIIRREEESSVLRSALIVRLSEELLASLPKAWDGASLRPLGEEFTGRRKRWSPSARRSSELETSAAGRSRYLFPFLDYRLLRLTAGMPSTYFVDGTTDRKLARAASRTCVPESISNRVSGLQFSPAYLKDLQKNAIRGISRLPDFRDAGLDEIFDLNWLEQALVQLSEGAMPYATNLVYAPITLLAAEFLLVHY